jgi:Haem-degrading
MKRWLISGAFSLSITLSAYPALADFADCSLLPSQSDLEAALKSAVAANNGGLGFDMWATLVAIDGSVCAIAFSGADYTGQWLGSRVISAQKANTANGFSLSKTAAKGGLALSTANLYSAVQPGGSLYGLQHSNPVDTAVAYQGSSSLFGTVNDPMVSSRIGGVNVFGGGLALYKPGGTKIGGVGVSGDTSCTDHMVAWRVRANLHLDRLNPVGGVSGDPKRPDNIIFDITPNPDGGTGISKGGFGHPTCLNNPDSSTLPMVH